jgi:hypothetical protein
MEPAGQKNSHDTQGSMREVVEEAYELVEEGLITERDFRDFMFVNPVTLWTGMNPDFFKGTVVETAVTKVRGEQAL